MDARKGADAADSARDSRECRICHAGAEDGPLSQPCGCRGSASWVHRACLERWRRSSTRRDAAYRCGTCKVEFRDELSLELLRARLDAQRERGSAGALHSMSRLAVELQAQGRLAEAEPLLREALEVCRATRGASHSDTLLSTTRLAALLQDRGELAQAEPLCREALEASRAALGTRHATYLVAMNDLASLLHDRGKLSQAEPLYRECLAARRRLLGPRHPDTLVSLSNLGTLLRSLGRLEEAAPLQEAALQLARETLGRRHSDTLAYLSNLGLLRLAQGRLGEAEGLCREAAEESRATQGLQHPETAASMSNLAALLKAQGRLDEAQPATQPPPRLSVAAFFTPPARAPPQAEELYRAALESRRALLGGSHPSVLRSASSLSALLRARGRGEDAAEPPTRPEARLRRRDGPHRSMRRSVSSAGALPAADGTLVAEGGGCAGCSAANTGATSDNERHGAPQERGLRL